MADLMALVLYTASQRERSNAMSACFKQAELFIILAGFNSEETERKATEYGLTRKYSNHLLCQHQLCKSLSLKLKSWMFNFP